MVCGRWRMSPMAPHVESRKSVGRRGQVQSHPSSGCLPRHPRPGKEEGGGYGNQYGRTGLTGEWLLVGCLVVSYSIFKVTWPTCPWFEPAVKFSVIQYGRPVMRDRPGSLRERLARVWIRVRTDVPVGTWKVWRAMEKEAGD